MKDSQPDVSQSLHLYSPEEATVAAERPASPPEATWIEIYSYRSDEEQAEHVVRIDLPLPAWRQPERAAQARRYRAR